MQAPNLFPEKLIGIRAAPLTRKQIRRAQQLSSLLWECGDDVEFWAERLGYDIYERELPDHVTGVLQDGFIVLRKGLSSMDQILSIAHEIFHHEFHATASAYRELPDKAIDLQENQAESFAVLVAEPSILKYDSIQDFYYKSELPDLLKPLRERLAYLIRY